MMMFQAEDSSPFSPGMRILCRDAEWLVQRVEPANFSNTHHAVHCLGIDDLVRGHQAVFLTQLDELKQVRPEDTRLKPDSSRGFRLARLYLEAQLRQMPCTGLEPDLVGMGAFQPMKFQRYAVEHALRQSRVRLLLADDVGLGKTIQVGMILSELMRRGRADRVLVLAKKSMLEQFQAELWNRFAIPLIRLDSHGIQKLRLRIPANKNPFEVYHRVIISLDTLKNIGAYRHFLEQTHWNAVVIDEAHNVAGASNPSKNLSYRLARRLSRTCDNMLLTTATPHNGKHETFGRLISLLDPSAIPDPDYREYKAEDIRGFFLMRFKEDVRGDVAEYLPDRKVVPLCETDIDATAKEEQVYEAFGNLRLWSKERRESGKRGSRLLDYGYYKLFLSSPEACLSTIQSRSKKLAAQGDREELLELEKIAALLKDLSITQTARYDLLKQQLEKIGWRGSSKCPRILVFTESRKTQDALAQALSKDYSLKYNPKFDAQAENVLGVIHGGMPGPLLNKAIEAFGTGSAPMRILIATDVASEGINLHYECHNVIHYDLPWSIITLIQRNGRVDRLGQEKDPILRYLIVNTHDGLLSGDREIFERLIEKAEEINRTTRSGESVLRLYDEEKEEEHIAEDGILGGNKEVLESPIGGEEGQEASELEEMLRLAQELDETESEDPEHAETESRLRLYSDKEFLVEGYDFIRERYNHFSQIQSTKKLLLLYPPDELKHALGMVQEQGAVLSGRTAVPDEASPVEGDAFRLTDDPKQVSLAIRAAQQTSGRWSKELLITDQHPILRWLGERILMLLDRGEAPYVLTPHLEKGELCFCFIGQVSAKGGSPLISDAHAIRFGLDGAYVEQPLQEALAEAGFEELANTEEQHCEAASEPLLAAAVEASLKRMTRLQKERDKVFSSIMRKEERRLLNWSRARQMLLEERIAKLPENHPKAREYSRHLEDIEKFTEDRRKNWLHAQFLAADRPSTRLVLVMEGR